MNEKQIHEANAYIARIKRERAFLDDLDDPRHGTKSGYEMGCRCYRCKTYEQLNPPTQFAKKVRRAARQQISRKVRLRSLQTDPNDSRHGTNTGYVTGCRCDRCTQAHSHALMKWRQD